MGEGSVTKNGKGAAALLSVALIVAMLGMVWSSLDSGTGRVADSVATLERLTDQRLAAMEAVIYRPVDRIDHPIKHTESISTLQTDVRHADQRSEERRQEMMHELQAHTNIEGHPHVVTGLAAIEEKLVEVETQFRHLDRLIQLLWQRTYGEPLPNPPEK